jgi:SSS family solute:Na+ symporter
LQGLVLVVGGIICLPIILKGLPDGFSTIIEVGREHNKFSVGSTAFIFTKKTIWVMLLNHIFHYAQMMCTDQMIVQRYVAMRSEKQARFGLILGSLSTIPVWIFFTFIGTALFVFYKVQPNIAVKELEPIQVMPYFILTEVPAGIAGFILAALFAAAMSTLDSSNNASAATITSDFYRRLFVKDESEIHYLKIGRWLSVLFGVIMISVALIIHFFRNIPVVDLQQIFIAILSGGLLGLFLLGLLTKNVDSVAAMVATGCTVLGITIWLIVDSQWFLSTDLGQKYFSNIIMPDKLMMNVVANTFLFTFGYIVTALLRRRNRKDLTDLTVWSLSKNKS